MAAPAKRSHVRATTEEWRLLGRDDPFFAVAAHEGRRRSWDEKSFYDLGRSDWEDFRRHWLQYEPNLGGAVVEIGCGAGRITKQLVQHFDRVVALDVSPEMVALAERAAPEAAFSLVHGVEVPVSPSSMDAVFTCHVLQHLENADVVEAYLQNIRDALRPGGTVMAHLLVVEAPPSLAHAAWSEAKLRYTRARSGNKGAYSRVRRYRPDEVRHLFESVGLDDVELREFRTRAGNVVHAFWFARA